MPDEISLPDQFFAAARGWVGTPWVNGGRTRGVGISCTGMLIMAARAVGLAVDDIPVDEARASGRELRNHLRKYCEPIPNDRLATGAVALMHGAPAPLGALVLPTHVGVVGRVGDNFHIVHVPRFVQGKGGYCVETRFDPWQHGLRSLWWARAFNSELDARSHGRPANPMLAR